MNILITLAGKSSRFKKAGIKKQKFLLPLSKKTTVISEILNNYDDNDNFHFVLTKSQKKKYLFLENYLRKLKKNIYINIINDHDYGPAYSAQHAKTCKNKNDVIISYCDFLIEWNYNKFKREIFSYDFGITSFKGFHPSSFSGTLYCYLKTLNNEVINLREKKSFTSQPHLESASTGSYYFKDFSIFLHYAEMALKNKNFLKDFKEIYVSLLYLLVLKDNKKILNFEVDNFISLGTPRDYKEFLNWKNFFDRY